MGGREGKVTVTVNWNHSLNDALKENNSLKYLKTESYVKWHRCPCNIARPEKKEKKCAWLDQYP